MAELTSAFRVAGDLPAGLVSGRRKTFTQTIRARSDEVTRIPAIPFSYFDPQTERYVTVTSDPIEIDVRPASTLADTQIIGANGLQKGTVTELTEVAGGILANESGPAVLLSQQAFTPSWVHAAAVTAPPIVFAVIAAARRRVQRLRGDRGHARRRSAKRRALRRLTDARRAEATEEAQATALALSDYVSDRCNLPPGALTSAEVVEKLHGRRVPADLVADVESLLGVCEALRYAGGDAAETDSITQRAARCIARLERERI